MSDLATVIDYLDSLLVPAKYELDNTVNGVQIDAGVHTARRIAFAVDAAQSVIEKAVVLGADLLVVHHGIFWGRDLFALRGPNARKVSLLMKAPCSLYCSHLPLDGNTECGHAAELLRMIGAGHVEPFGVSKGMTVGCKGRLSSPTSISEISDSLSKLEGCVGPLVLPFGTDEIRTIGIVTGGGSSHLMEAYHEKVDLFISGEPSHWVFHLAKEHRMNAIFAGHYATETVGLKALARLIETSFGIETVWISEPSGI